MGVNAHHSTSLSNGKQKRDANQKWRRQMREQLSAVNPRKPPPRPRSRPKKGKKKTDVPVPVVDSARKGSKSLFLM